MSELKLAWAIFVTDGNIVRTITPAGLGPDRAGRIETALIEHLFPPAVALVPASTPGPSDKIREATKREAAKLQGFTGDICDNCGSAEMKFAGKCLTCQACGATTGCS